MAKKEVHMPELWAAKGLTNLDPSYVGSILVKGKVQLSIPHNSGIRGAWKAIIQVLVSPYPTTNLCKISGTKSV